MSAPRWVAASVLLLPLAAHAGAFIFADEGDPDSITHPTGYTGSGGPRVLTVCLRTAVPPTAGTITAAENTLIKAVETWNQQRVAVSNLGLGTANDIPSGTLDFESVLLHEVGHCLGLAHSNHASESGLPSPQINGTKSHDGANNVFNQAAGPDGLHGSSDDVRGDDGNLYWYRSGSNDPLAYPAIIDSSTFRISGGLPGGHTFARNADRDVLAALGVSNTESVLQQGQFTDEAQRRLTGEDMATIRLGMAGLDETQGNSDDYTIALDYIGRVQNCNITVEFNSASSFAFCQVGGSGIGGTDHVRITSAALNFSPTTNWFFSPAPNTTTTITADTPDPSPIGSNYSVTAAVAVNTSSPNGPATGQVEIRDDLGSTCIATLASGSGSCNLNGASAGTRTLTATYLGFRGFDASTSVGVTHTIGSAASTLVLSESPATTVVGQPYTVSATVSGSAGTPTGSVGINDGRGASCMITLSGGSGSCQLATTSAGAVTLSGSYAGNASYEGSTDAEPHTVNPASTSTTIVSDNPDPSSPGPLVTVAFTVTPAAPGAGTPGGSVTVTGNGGLETCTATLPQSSCQLALNQVGPRVLTAVYSGSADFNSSSDTENHTVGGAGSITTILTDSPDSSRVGQAVMVSWSVAPMPPALGVPSGSVNITASGGSESCSASFPSSSCMITLLAAGARTLTATYAGDANFSSSSDTEAHTVLAATTTTTIQSITPQPAPLGSSYQVTAQVGVNAPGAGSPGGDVDISDGAGGNCTGTLSGGSASCSITPAAAGDYTVTASFAGNANFLPSSDTEAQQVFVPTELAIESITPFPTPAGDPATIVISIQPRAGLGAPTGNVTISTSREASTCQILLPQSECDLVLVVDGLHVIRANYSGDADYAPAQAEQDHIVGDLPPEIFTDGFESP